MQCLISYQLKAEKMSLTQPRLDTTASIVDLIGRTPLLRLRKLGPQAPGVELYAKAEFQNPGGSVKDRAAASIIREGERTGRLHRGVTILDATSGNTGIAYAMIAAAHGYRLKLCVPENVTMERKRTLRAFGVDLVLTNPLEGSDGAIREARRLYAESPDQYFYADQYNNDANWRAHYDTTALEILEQTDGRVTHFVAGLGTSGTFMGVARRLREHDRNVRVISVQPDSALHGIEGLKHMDTAIRPGIYDPALADENLVVDTERAYELTRRLAGEEGLLVGVSSGAALAASLDVAAQMREGVIVTIFPDGGSRYLSERFWDGDPDTDRRHARHHDTGALAEEWE
jgi:S-sulfo-L-cysteine synthase (O-acetyl-L-serine-dependent)